MYIPALDYTFYGPIVLGSIMVGIAAAGFLMHKAGAKKITIFYTAVLTLVMIIMVSLMTSMALTNDIRKVSFNGAGGALGLILGAITSALIHRDHPIESISAWITVSPLIYGLSKTACHIAGCCNGIPYNGPLHVTYEIKNDASFFPVQLTETVVFILIFIAGLILYLKMKNKIRAAAITCFVSAVAKDLIEFLRESHMEQTISGYQILVLSIALIFAIASFPMSKKLV